MSKRDRIPNEELRIRFTYHPPKDTGQQAKYEVLRGNGFTLTQVINEICPASYERDEALKRVEEAIMWANAALARRYNVQPG